MPICSYSLINDNVSSTVRSDQRIIAFAVDEMANKLWFLLAVLCAVFTLGEFAAILRRQVLQEHVINGVTKGLAKDETEADPGDPLFLTPYIKKGEYQTGMAIFIIPFILQSILYSSYITSEQLVELINTCDNSQTLNRTTVYSWR